MRGDFKVFPLSQSQRNIWDLEQLYPNNPMNNICTSVRIKGHIDVTLVRYCINHILQHDSSLRTQVSLVGGSPFQFQIPYQEEQFPFYNFSMTDENGFSRWESTIAQMVMPISESPLYQFYIYKFDEKSGGILIKVHHLIADGFSVVDLVNRISSVYLALLSKEEASSEDMLDYEQHVISEKNYLSSDTFEKDRDYWKNQIERFNGERAFLRQNSNTNTSSAGERCSFRFSELLNHAIMKFCTQNRVAPFNVYCIALAIYMNRMSGQNRICLGVPIMNRAGSADKRTGGMFVNTLPFFFETDTKMCLNEATDNLTDQWYDLLRHHSLPFSEIAKIYNEKDETELPIFDVVLSYQEGSVFRSSEATMLFSGKWLYSGYQREQMIIHLTGFNGENRFAVDYDYLTQLYSQEDVVLLHSNIEKILTELLAHPQAPMMELPLMRDEELEKVLYTFNRTENEEDRQTIAEAFLQIVEKSPNNVALIYEDRKITYGELYQRALALAPHIRSACSKKKENIIALFLPRSIDLIIAMLATAFSGNAFVILAPELPKGRLMHILSDSGCAALITASVYAAHFSDETIKTLLVDCLPESLPAQEEPIPLGFDDLAYVCYTSGSSGTPKGVMVEQGSLTSFSQGMEAIYGTGGVLSICNIGFDVFLSESISALLRGRTVILATQEQCNNPEALAKLIMQYAARFTSTVPSRLDAYLANPAFAAAISHMDRIVLGGEPLSSDLVRKIKKLTNANIYNMYGPTETTIGVSCKCVNESPSLSAGRPMAHCKLYVLDEHLKPLPVDACGELYIGGRCVGRGYLNNEEATRKSFIGNEFEPNQRIYRSGDIAYWNKFGEINICGRRDAQIKLNGNRIEPQEITAAVLAHPSVQQAAVNIVKRDSGGDIVAYYTSAAPIAQAELYDFCASYLPAYMIPQHFMRVESIPLTLNGKLDVKKLPHPSEKAKSQGVVSKTQQTVLNVFRAVLKKDTLTVDSAYLQNGGDSLNALAVISEIHKLTGTQLTFTDLRVLATPANIAAKIDGALNEEYVNTMAAVPETAAISALPPAGENASSYPLTPIQRTLFFSALSDPTSICYNMPGCFSLPFEPNAEKLENAFRQLIKQEELLRTSFAFEGADAIAKIHSSAPFALEHLEADSYTKAAEAFVRPFDLGQAPLIRAGLWQKDGQTVLLMDVHHIVNDGEGTPILFEKLDALYRGMPINDSGITYRDFARCAPNAALHSAATEYWRNRLSGLSGGLALPTDYPRRDEFDFKGDSFAFKMDTDLSEAVTRFCADQAITPYAFFAAAFGLLLSTVSGQNDFIVGAPVAGRTLPETRNMAGAFINTLPLRFRIAGQQTAADFLQSVFKDVANLIDHANLGYEECLAAADINHGKGHDGLYTVMFSMRPAYEKGFMLNGCALTALPVNTNCAKMELVLEAVKTKQNYAFSFEYATSLFSKNTIAMYGRSLLAIVADILKNPEAEMKDIDSLSQEDRETVLSLSKGKTVPFTDMLLDSRMDAYANAHPDADAIFFGDERLSYAMLRDRSDSIAALLASGGVKRGDVVGLYCERTPDLICGLFGIMKTGAAYLPLSSHLPNERMVRMLDRAGVKTVLTDKETADIDAKYIKRIIPKGLYRFSPRLRRETTDIAQVLFTSGSTGEPKGIMISHHALSNLVNNLGQIYADGHVEGNVLSSSSVLFDSFTMEVLVPLTLGISVVLADSAETVTPWMLTARIQKSHVQAMFSTPSRMNMLLDDALFSDALSSLKVVLVGGEAMSSSLAKQLNSLCGGHVYNLYGPAEATVYVAFWRISADEVPAIGYPAPNTEVYILDEAMRPVIPGTPGEIYIGGHSLSDGYIAREDMTEAAFVANPFADEGEKLYRSGDMARMPQSGRIEYLGRRDHQIKLFGQRIELEEIVGAMMDTGLVLNAAVDAVKTENGDAIKALRGFVVQNKEKPFDAAALRRELNKTLPPYMIPAAFVTIDTIPLTVTGKTDFKALAAIKETSVAAEENPLPKEVQSAGETSREAIRVILEGIWKEVLATNSIDESQSFFEQGGGSLSAMNLLIHYFKHGWKLKLNALYENPSLLEQLDFICKEYGEMPLCPPSQEAKETEAVLVTGARGFLGAHIVYELLRQGAEALYCLVRSEKQAFFDTLAHYFGDQWVERNAEKLVLIIGDIRKPRFDMQDNAYQTLADKIFTVYHCAADVRHYAEEDAIMDTNVNGTKNTIAFCRDAGAYLGFVSTLSVGGEKILPAHKARYFGLKEIEFDENCVDIGQNWTDSVYIRSKFFAEAEVKKAAANGLKAKILRVGRLVGRAADGKFQQNQESNYFFNVITGMARLGAVPLDVSDILFELTAVDSCAKAVITAMDAQMDVMHLSNPYGIPLGTIIETLMNGTQEKTAVVLPPMKQLDMQAYTQLALNDPLAESLQVASMLNSSLALIGDEDIKVNIVCQKSNAALEELGFHWEEPIVSIVLNEFS